MRSHRRLAAPTDRYGGTDSVGVVIPLARDDR